MRDLLKVILEKILTIPNTVSSAVVQQLLAAREVTVGFLRCHARGQAPLLLLASVSEYNLRKNTIVLLSVFVGCLRLVDKPLFTLPNVSYTDCLGFFLFLGGSLHFGKKCVFVTCLLCGYRNQKTLS